jgi:hypothetical protein
LDADQTPSTENPGWYQNFRESDGSVLKDSVGCDNKFCDNEGLYYTTKTCCGDVKIHCRGCFTSLFEQTLKREKAGYTYTCEACNTKNYPTRVFNKVKKIRLASV